MLFLTDRQKVPIGISEPISGKHNDVFNFKIHFNQSLSTLQKTKINISGLFLNTDAGFDCEELRKACFQYDIIPNFAINSRNSNHKTQNHIFDKELHVLRFSMRGLMPELIVIETIK